MCCRVFQDPYAAWRTSALVLFIHYQYSSAIPIKAHGPIVCVFTSEILTPNTPKVFNLLTLIENNT